MRLIQPPPQRTTEGFERSKDWLKTVYPLYNIQSRYRHHAGGSGYDQLSRYLGETLEIRPSWYWLGETILRPICLAHARCTGHTEYSRYDCSMELDVMSRMRKSPRSVYHFLYAEKGYRLSRCAKRNHIFVGTVHHPVSHHSKIFKKMDHFVALDAIFVLSRDSVDPWKRIVEHEHVYFIPHGVDCDYFRPSDDEAEKLIVFSGYHERDYETLALVAELFLSRRHDWRLMMISRDPRCRAIAAKYKNAIVAPQLSNEEYVATLKRSAVMLLPLKVSTACNSTLEALACGVPVVTSSEGMESYVTESCGRVCEVGDADTMTMSIEELIDSPGKLRSARTQARMRALEISWPIVARKIAHYIELLWNH